VLRALKLGAADFLIKPINISHLSAKLELLISHSASAPIEASLDEPDPSEHPWATTEELPIFMAIELAVEDGRPWTIAIKNADGLEGKLCFEDNRLVFGQVGELVGLQAFDKLTDWSGEITVLTGVPDQSNSNASALGLLHVARRGLKTARVKAT
jgi:hypothetical protein